MWDVRVVFSLIRNIVLPRERSKLYCGLAHRKPSAQFQEEALVHRTYFLSGARSPNGIPVLWQSSFYVSRVDAAPALVHYGHCRCCSAIIPWKTDDDSLRDDVFGNVVEKQRGKKGGQSAVGTVLLQVDSVLTPF